MLIFVVRCGFTIIFLVCIIMFYMILSWCSRKVAWFMEREAILVWTPKILFLNITYPSLHTFSVFTLVRVVTDTNFHYLSDCHLPLILFLLPALILIIVQCSLYHYIIIWRSLSMYMTAAKSCHGNMWPFFDTYGDDNWMASVIFWIDFIIIIHVILVLVIEQHMSYFNIMRN